ncbi:MAG TPA: PIG-L family deacetylase [Emcibacteraceae bacterium]|nr:PIG-L family deacetylase [Emcibacteraceae bacterium]
MKNILVVAAHPDDEALGAAGTLARHAAAGDAVHIAFLADGEGARGDKEGLEKRRKAARAAAKVIGAQNVSFYDFPDNRMDSIALLDVAQCIEEIIDQVNPQIIYTHHGGDLNIDHQITHRAVLTACRPMPGSQVEAVYGFEVLSSTEWASPDQDAAFRPSHHVDIASYWEQKKKSLECYADEMRDFPHVRSYKAVEALATIRGAQVGLTMAESFTVIRQIKR